LATAWTTPELFIINLRQWLQLINDFGLFDRFDQRIAAPRLSTPRVRVPVGSVGIAGMQTGIYSVSTPGGWRIIGRTPLKPFDLSRGEPVRFKPGDAVQFYAIDPGEYVRFESAC